VLNAKAADTVARRPPAASVRLTTWLGVTGLLLLATLLAAASCRCASTRC
jgi:hypothetical protein